MTTSNPFPTGGLARRSLLSASLDPPVLRFSPLAWLKLQYLCHFGQTEVGGFGISAAADLLYIEDVQTLMQGATSVSIEFSDTAVADHFDRYADQDIAPARCGRIWIHTHPGASASPSRVDEATFTRVFGPSDWALMFILSRTGQTYARLRFNSGPGGEITVSVTVDWSAWPDLLHEQGMILPDLLRQWRQEYDSNVFDLSTMGPGRRRDEPTRDDQQGDPQLGHHGGDDADDVFAGLTSLYDLDAELEALAESAYDGSDDHQLYGSGWDRRGGAA